MRFMKFLLNQFKVGSWFCNCVSFGSGGGCNASSRKLKCTQNKCSKKTRPIQIFMRVFGFSRQSHIISNQYC